LIGAGASLAYGRVIGHSIRESGLSPVLSIQAAIHTVVVVDDQPRDAIGLDVLDFLGVAGRVLYLTPLDAEQMIPVIFFDDDRLFGQLFLLFLMKSLGTLLCFALNHGLVESTFHELRELFGHVRTGI